LQQGEENMQISTLVSLASALTFFLGCSSTTTRSLQGTNLTPAAEGKVSISKADNNNVGIDVMVKHLAPPQRVSSSATTYVVWLQPTAGDTRDLQNMGALKVDEDLNGRLRTVAPHRNFQLFITAEPSAMVTFPAGEKILEVPLTQVAE